MYEWLGDTKKADELYGRGIQYGVPWSTGLALSIQADRLENEGKEAEARRLLQRPITGPGSETVQIQMLARIAGTYYAEGNFVQVRSYAEQALSLNDKLKNPDVYASVDMAGQLIHWMDRWAKAPIYCDTETFRLYAKAPAETLNQQFIIHAYHETPLVFSTNNPDVKVRQIDNWVKGVLYSHEARAELAVTTHGFQQNIDDVLVITSPSFPNFKLSIPIHVEVPPLLSLSTQILFFGSVRQGQPATVTFQIVGLTPFHILRVESDNSCLKANIPSSVPRLEQTVTVTLTANQQPRIVEGKLRISTDLAGAPPVDLTYMARVT